MSERVNTQSQSQSQSQYKIGIFIFPGFPMACLTSLIEPLRAANEISGKRAFCWSLLSETKDRVQSSAEIGFDPLGTLSRTDDADLIILLSPPGATFVYDRTPVILSGLYRHGAKLGAISGGVFPLARAGLVRDKPISVHWCYRAAYDAEFPNHRSSDNVIEVNSDLITASGSAAAFEVALHLIEEQLNKKTATEVACWFQHPMMRSSDVAQIVPNYGDKDTSDATLPPLVGRAVDLFARDMSIPWAVGDIAERLNISTRHLERIFKEATGISPSHYYRKMRMEAARQIVMYTNDQLSDVAAAVGYENAQAFSKYYQNTFGVTPSADRKRINLYRTKGNIPVPSV